MSFNFHAKDLDGAYEKLYELNTLATKDGSIVDTSGRSRICRAT